MIQFIIVYPETIKAIYALIDRTGFCTRGAWMCDAIDDFRVIKWYSSETRSHFSSMVIN